MANQSTALTSIPDSRVRSWLKPHRIALVLLWLVAKAAFVTMLFQDVRHTGRFSTARTVPQ